VQYKLFDLDDKRVSTAHIIYTNDSNRWWSRFVHPEYKHVSILQHDEFNYYEINYSAHGLDVEILPANAKYTDIDFVIDSYLSMNQVTAVQSVVYIGDKNRTLYPLLLGCFSCVAVAKAVVGMKCNAITPYQLYKYISNHDTDACGRYLIYD
jgi:hypothetical protein